MAKKVKAHWERSKKPKMLLAHFSVDELKAFDTLQGGPSIDPETGIREYSALREIIKKPKVRALFHEVTHLVEKDLADDGKLSAPLNKVYKSSKKQLLPFRETLEEKESPEVKSLEATGVGGDTKLAWIPYEFAELLIDIRGEPVENPHTGLLMFGFFDTVVRIVAPIVAVAATPFTAGTSLGLLGMAGTGALASWGAHKLTGASNKEAMQAGLMGGLGSLGAGMGPAFGLNTHLARGLGTTAGGMLGGQGFGEAAKHGVLSGGASYGMGKLGEAGYLPSWMGGGEAGGRSNPNVATSDVGLNSSASAAKGVADKAAGVGSTGLLGGLGNMLGGNSGMLIPAAMAGLSYMGSQQKYKRDKREHAQALDKQEKRRQAAGYNDPWVPVKAKDVRIRKNPDFYNSPSWAVERGIYETPYSFEDDPGYAKGGQVKASWENPSHHDQTKLQSPVEGVLIKGPGKGQQDKIKTTVPENCYIIDASSTGMFGDGSSDAGAKVLKEFEEQVKGKFPRRKAAEIYHHTEVSSRQLPVYLSDSEYKFDPVTVTMLGNGSNTKGAAMLKSMVKNLRAHKSIRGGGLPPKAKSPWSYIQDRG